MTNDEGLLKINSNWPQLINFARSKSHLKLLMKKYQIKMWKREKKKKKLKKASDAKVGRIIGQILMNGVIKFNYLLFCYHIFKTIIVRQTFIFCTNSHFKLVRKCFDIWYWPPKNWLSNLQTNKGNLFSIWILKPVRRKIILFVWNVICDHLLRNNN